MSLAYFNNRYISIVAMVTLESLMLWFCLTLFTVLIYPTTRLIRRLLAPKVQARNGVVTTDMTHVGLSPGNTVLSYSGDTNWDLGFLSLGAMLRYYGCGALFALKPEQVISVEMRTQDIVGIRTARLFIHWVPVPGGAERAFSLEVRDAASQRDMVARTQRLRDDINAWRQAGAAMSTDEASVVPDFSRAPAGSQVLVVSRAHLIAFAVGMTFVYNYCQTLFHHLSSDPFARIALPLALLLALKTIELQVRRRNLRAQQP